MRKRIIFENWGEGNQLFEILWVFTAYEIAMTKSPWQIGTVQKVCQDG